MKREKKYKGLYVVGVVYKYTSPSGKSYIGQTTNELHRRRTWFCTKYRYAGTAINRARAKYGPENFTYEVLYKQVFSSFYEAQDALDEVEKYYIERYDTLKNGYNNTPGGLVPEFGIYADAKDRVIEKKRVELSAWQIRRLSPKHTKKEIQQLRKETNRKRGRWQKIFQFSMDGVFIREFASAGEAQELGYGHPCNIKRACKTLGNYKGYAWRFAEDGYEMKVKPKRVYDRAQFEHNYKPVSQYTKDGCFIRSFESITEAAHFLNIPYTSCISACLRGRTPSAHGFKWKYKII